jgi:exopolyphosphatase/guanosine-5'-triphosphate,3'-diphosphate pyrophosphatase
MNYAVIDMGSNTMRLVVYRYENKRLSAIISQKEMACLAGYVKDKQMAPEGISKACNILRAFREIAIRFVDEADVHVFATASLRGIQNQKQVLDAIQRSCGFLPEVLTGEEEARLDFIGASHFTRCDNGVLIDIGGASTELVHFQDLQPKELVSIPIGCLNLYTQFVDKMIPTDKERKKVKKEIKAQFEKYIRWNIKENLPLMIGVGGTVRAAYKLSCDLFMLPSDQPKIQTAYIKKTLQILKHNESNVYQTVYRQIPERAQTISTGLLILKEAINHFRCDTLLVSSFGVREGYLIDRVLTEDEVNAERDNGCDAVHAEQGAVMAEI